MNQKHKPVLRRSSNSPNLYLAVLAFNCLFGPMLVAQSNRLESDSNAPRASSGFILHTNQVGVLPEERWREAIIGTWCFSVTNASQWMNTKTEYRGNGTYRMEGDVGATDSPLTGRISSSGIWNIKGGQLYTTVTNNARGKRINETARDKIIMVTTNSFSYRTERDEVRTVYREKN